MPYTVFNPAADLEAGATSGLTAEQAAEELLGHDGYRWEIRPDGKGFRLWRSIRGGGGNLPLSSAAIYSAEDTEEAARAEIFAEALTRKWESMEVMTDADFEAMLAEAREFRPSGLT